MVALTKISENFLINEAFDRFSKANIPVERTVIVEKYKKPSMVSGSEIKLTEYSHMNHVEISWYNSLGNLHSFHDRPSRISFNSSDWLTVEWHKNGEPYRKGFKFNKIRMQTSMMFSMGMVKFFNPTLELLWLNKEGNLHSFNDEPALINSNSVVWYNNGKICRMSYCLNTELPCIIFKSGDMIFCKNKHDSNEHVKYPFSKKYYGHAIKAGLRYYEKYVEWSIRELMTF